jgi:hypothetical protein
MMMEFNRENADEIMEVIHLVADETIRNYETITQGRVAEVMNRLDILDDSDLSDDILEEAMNTIEDEGYTVYRY